MFSPDEMTSFFEQVYKYQLNVMLLFILQLFMNVYLLLFWSTVH